MTETTTSEQFSVVSTTRRGAIARWRQVLIPTTRDTPADATTASHTLLVRAGFIRQVGAGVYNYLPLAHRSIAKITAIIREEMDRAGAAEMFMPVLTPVELFAASKRDQDYGDLLFRVEDRHGRVSALGPTHEELITDLLKNCISSYKQLPLTLYQIQTKFRDEFRPRSALLRGREFLMKDAYSFHTAIEGEGGLKQTYDVIYDAYTRIFQRLGLDFSAVEAESGPIGGSASHEFMVNADSGEDTILVDRAAGYAANVEKCEIGERSHDLTGAPTDDLEKVHTPNLPGIDGVAEHLGVSAADMLKCVVFEPKDDAAREAIGHDWVLAVVRGDHEANEGKVRDLAGGAVVLGDEKRARAAGFAIGYVSPCTAESVSGTLLLIDPDAAQPGPASSGWVTGADEPDHHVKHFTWSRELGDTARGNARVGDIRNAVAGDPSPRSDGTLDTQRGIEVGHIFKLGTKYSAAMGLVAMDKDQKREPVIMGCYGLGVSRTLAACVEMSHDDSGIVWTPAIAPYHVEIVLMKPDDAEQAEACDRIAGRLADAGVDVLIDDRPERPGVKFNDADLIGLPVRLTIGGRSLADGNVEFKRRSDEGKGEPVALDGVVDAVLAALADKG
ncbi:MAG: proline--tRNA ligase [Planctomycetota bacterium]